MEFIGIKTILLAIYESGIGGKLSFVFFTNRIVLIVSLWKASCFLLTVRQMKGSINIAYSADLRTR